MNTHPSQLHTLGKSVRHLRAKSSTGQKRSNLLYVPKVSIRRALLPVASNPTRRLGPKKLCYETVVLWSCPYLQQTDVRQGQVPSLRLPKDGASSWLRSDRSALSDPDSTARYTDIMLQWTLTDTLSFWTSLARGITQTAGRWLLISKPRVCVRFVNERIGTAERLSESSVYNFPSITIMPRPLHTLLSPTA
jgi:hypothetical protein